MGRRLSRRCDLNVINNFLESRGIHTYVENYLSITGETLHILFIESPILRDWCHSDVYRHKTHLKFDDRGKLLHIVDF